MSTEKSGRRVRISAGRDAREPTGNIAVGNAVCDQHGVDEASGEDLAQRNDDRMAEGDAPGPSHPPPPVNGFLVRLPRADFQLLAPHLKLVELRRGTILTEVGQELDHVYFPLEGMISVVLVMRDGKAIDTGMIGRSGLVGAAAGIGSQRSPVRSVVQIAGSALRMSALQFRASVSQSATLLRFCIADNEGMLAQARTRAACNALHYLEARFARWLLQISATIGSDTIALTQEFLAEMLGVRRTSVTDVASELQINKVISYSRGVIRILDRTKLEEAACECLDMPSVEQTATST